MDNFEEMARDMELMPEQETEAYIKIYDTLNAIHQEDSNADRGLGFGGMDVWLEINGREHFVNVKPSLRQNKQDELKELADRTVN